MAKKVERLEVDDDTKFDPDIDFDSMDFDSEIGGMMDDDLTSDNRSPVMKALSSTVEAGREELLNTDNYKDIIKNAMPSEYGKITRDLSPLTSKLKDTYREQVDVMKPGLKDLARTVDKLIPQEKENARNLLNRVREKLGIEDDYYSKGNSREGDMKNNLDDIFNEQKEVDNERYIRDKAEDKIEKGIEEKRFKAQLNVSSSMQSDIARLRQYNDRINIAYQKKSLELQYKSLFVATDLLAETKRSNSLFRPQLMAIAKNTALPEIQKQRLTENVKETLRDRFKKNVDRSLFDKGGYFQRGVDNVIGRINEKLQTVNDKVDSINQASGSVTDMMDMGGSVNMGKEEILAEGLMTFIAGFLTEDIGDKVKDKVFTKDKADSGIYRKLIQASKYTNDLPGLIHDLRSSDKLQESFIYDPTKAGLLDKLKNKVGNVGKSALSSILESFDEDYIGGSLSSGQGVHAVDVADGFDTRTKKTINDIIPGLLSMQLKELQIIRTGRQDVELVRYDYKEGKFSNTSELAERFRTDLIKRSTEGGLDRKVKEIVKDLVGDKKLSSAADIALTRRVKSLSNQKGIFDTKFLKSDAFYKGMDPAVVDEIKLVITDNFDSTKKGFTLKDKDIADQFSDLRETLKDPRAYIDDFARLGNIDILENLGLVTKGTYDRGNISTKGIENLITGKGIKQYQSGNVGLVGPNVAGTDTQGSAIGKPKMLHEVELIRKALSDYPKQIVDKLTEVVKELTTTVTSDINAKENIQATDSGSILDRFKKFKIFNWKYKKGRGDNREHTGPMAQDINATFGNTAAPGGKSIDLTTLNGINMAAIGELYEKYLSLEERNEIDNLKDTRSILLSMKRDTAVIAKRSGIGFGFGDLNIDLHKLVVGLQHLLPDIDLDGIKEGMYQLGEDGKKRYRTGKEFIEGYVKDKKEQVLKSTINVGKRLYNSADWAASKLRRPARVARVMGKKLYRRGKKYWNENGDDIKESVKETLFNLKDSAFEMMNTAADKLKYVYSDILPAGYSFIKDRLGEAKSFILDTYNRPIDVYVKGQVKPSLRAIVMKAGGYLDSVTGAVIKNLGDIKGEVKDLEGNVVLSFDDIGKGLIDAHGNAVTLGVSGMRDLAKDALGGLSRKMLGAGKDVLAIAGKVGNAITDKLSGIFPGLSNIFGSFDFSQFGIFNDKTNMYLEQIRDLINYRLPGTPTDFGLGEESSNSFIGPKRPKDLIERTIKEKVSNTKSGILDAFSKTKNRIFGGKDDDFVGPLPQSGNLGDRFSALKESMLGRKKDQKGFDGNAKYQGGNIFTRGMGMLGGLFGGNKDSEFVGPVQPKEDTKSDGLFSKIKGLLGNDRGGDFVGPLPQSGNLGDRFSALKESMLGRKKDQKGFDGKMRYKGANVIDKMIGMIGGNKDSEFVGPVQPKEDTKSDGLFSKIKDLLGNDRDDDSNKVSNPKFNDKDGDGDRDGNFSDRQKEIEKRKLQNKKEQIGFDSKMRYKGANVIDKMIGMVGGLMGGGSSVMSALGGAGDIAGAAGDLAGAKAATTGGIAGSAAKKPGLVARGLAGAKNLASAFLTGAGLLSGAGAVTATTGLAGVMAGIGAFLASPVVLTTLGVAATGYGIYKLGQFMTRNNSDTIDEVRLTQYGLSSEQSSSYHYMFELEQYLIDNVVGYGQDKQARLTGNKLDAEEIFSIFGIDKEDTPRAQALLTWFNGRFKPVFLTHLTALARINSKLKLSDIDDMEDEEKLIYLQGVAMPGGPYSVIASPLDEPLLATKADVDKAIDAVKEDLDVDEEKKKQIGKTGIDKPNAQAVGTATKLIEDSEQDKSMISKVNSVLKKVALGGLLGGSVELLLETNGDVKAMVTSVTGRVAKFFGLKTDYLEMARFHAYGLTKLNSSHTNAIRNLEEFILDNNLIRFNPDGTATFKGNMGSIISEPGSGFGIANSSDSKAADFTAWFNYRFLPVFLFVVGTGKKLVNQTYPEHIENAITDSQKYDLVNQITGLDVWSKANSPFKDVVLGTDNTINNSLLEELKTLKKDEDLKPPAGRVVGGDNKDPNLSNRDVPNTVSPTNKPPLVDVPDATKVVPYGVEGEKKPTTVTVSGGASGGNVGMSPIPQASGGLAMPEEGWAAIGGGKEKLNGVHPELLKNFLGMAAEYYKLTGKKISVNDGFRTFEEQLRLAKTNKFAAKPGNSLHEKGLAIDVSQDALNEAEKLGLMRKYGFTRPVGGEPWHMEAAVMQLDDQRARRDPNAAGELIKASVGRGGGGYGTIKGATPKRKNYAIAKSVVEEAMGKMVSLQEVMGNRDSQVPNRPIIKADSGMPNNPTAQAVGGTTARSSGGGFPAGGYATPVSQSADGGKVQSVGVGSGGGGYSGGGDLGANRNLPVESTGSNSGIVDIIKNAAKKVGMDENILVAMAAIESGFNPNAKSKASSATGLFQFLTKTWQGITSQKGSKYGIAPSTSRLDPNASALMAGEYIKQNFDYLSKFRKTLGPVEAYIAHFLGPGGAATFFKSDPNAPAAQVLPKAAASNKGIFYANGRPRTIREVYQHFAEKMRNKAREHGVNVSISSNLGGAPTHSDGTALVPGTRGYADYTKSQESGLSQSGPNMGGGQTQRVPMGRTDGFAATDTGSGGQDSYGGEYNNTPNIVGSAPVVSSTDNSSNPGAPLIDTSIAKTMSNVLTESLGIQKEIRDMIKKYIESGGSETPSKRSDSSVLKDNYDGKIQRAKSATTGAISLKRQTI